MFICRSFCDGKAYYTADIPPLSNPFFTGNALFSGIPGLFKIWRECPSQHTITGMLRASCFRITPGDPSYLTALTIR
jgi:hypothetical protein